MEFQQAHEIKPRPATLFMMAQCEYLLGELSYADFVAAIALQLVAPVSNDFIRLGAATRACCTDAALGARYAGLVAWRDRRYAKHRIRS